jgi:hypothetical protein
MSCLSQRGLQPTEDHSLLLSSPLLGPFRRSLILLGHVPRTTVRTWRDMGCWIPQARCTLSLPSLTDQLGINTKRDQPRRCPGISSRTARPAAYRGIAGLLYRARYMQRRCKLHACCTQIDFNTTTFSTCLGVNWALSGLKLSFDDNDRY